MTSTNTTTAPDTIKTFKKKKNVMYSECSEATLMQKRELKSAKNAEWRGYILSFATIGITHEVQCDADQFGPLIEGEEYALLTKEVSEGGRNQKRLILAERL